ncbi:MAG: hypothetical protein ACLGSA_01805 [Acidobacteriota bacterium]
MKQVLVAVLALTALASWGCGPVKPMTESEFKGFCYQYTGSPQQSCNTIPICDEYTVVMNTRQASLQKCLDECSAVYSPQRRQHLVDDCAGAAQTARDWCQRYCRTNYPQ